jgi:hypothetical protein
MVTDAWAAAQFPSAAALPYSGIEELVGAAGIHREEFRALLTAGAMRSIAIVPGTHGNVGTCSQAIGLPLVRRRDLIVIWVTVAGALLLPWPVA